MIAICKDFEQKENTRAVEEAIENCHDELLSYVSRRIPDSEIAEDIVQEALLSAWKNRHRFKGKSTPVGWFIGIVKRKIIDYFRKQIRNRNLQVSVGDSYEQLPACWSQRPEEPHFLAEKNELEAMVSECLREMPKFYRDVYLLHDQGLAPCEIAGRLSISKQNVWIRMFRARKFIKARIPVLQDIN